MINILIVDDSLTKQDKVCEVLSFFPQVNILHVTNTNQARILIRQQQFEIVIIDLNIKVSASSPPSINQGLAFAKLIFEDKKCIIPKDFFFLTELDDREKSDYKNKVAAFCSKLWFFKDDFIEWSTYLKSRVELYIEEYNRNHFDIIFFTALEEEFNEFIKNSNLIVWSNCIERQNSYSSCRGLFSIKNKNYTCLLVSPFKKGMSINAALTSLIIQKFNPTIAFMLGLCAGIDKSKQQYGDIIISEFIWDYHSGKIIDGGVFLNAPYQSEASSELTDKITNIFNDKNILNEYFTQNYRDTLFSQAHKIFIGPSVSGGTVIADSETVDKIKEQHKDIIGIDMEGYGFYEAFKFHSHSMCCMIKSISDFGDKEKNNLYRTMALDMNTKSIEHIISHDNFLELISDDLA